jgi:hypothetical protein
MFEVMTGVVLVVALYLVARVDTYRPSQEFYYYPPLTRITVVEGVTITEKYYN